MMNEKKVKFYMKKQQELEKIKEEMANFVLDTEDYGYIEDCLQQLGDCLLSLTDHIYK